MILFCLSHLTCLKAHSSRLSAFILCAVSYHLKAFDHVLPSAGMSFLFPLHSAIPSLFFKAQTKHHFLNVAFLWLCISMSQRNRTKSKRMCVYIKRKRFILKNWFIRLQDLAMPNFAEQVSRLETLEKVDVVVLSSKPIWKQNSFFNGYK